MHCIVYRKVVRTWGFLGAPYDPEGIKNDPKVSVGTLWPTIRLVITIGTLLDLFLAVIILFTHGGILPRFFPSKD